MLISNYIFGPWRFWIFVFYSQNAASENIWHFYLYSYGWAGLFFLRIYFQWLINFPLEGFILEMIFKIFFRKMHSLILTIQMLKSVIDKWNA